MVYAHTMVTRQFANKPTCGQSGRRLVNSYTTQLAEMCDGKFGVYNHSKYSKNTICTLSVFERVSVSVQI